MEKVDYKKELKHLYKPSGKNFSLVEVPVLQYLMIDGHGDPNTSKLYQESIEALYGMAYTVKFANKNIENTPDYTVMPLEGLWYMENMEEFSSSNKNDWLWTAMIMMPDFITSELFEQSRDVLKKKKNPARLNDLRLEKYEEGISVQILYTGSYSDEGPTIDAMHKFAFENGYKLKGKHHEIYLGDPRKTAPEKLKTVIRQPVTK